MSRARKQAYRSTEVSELARQMLYAPPGKREEVVRNAERFHDALEAEKNYPIDFVVYRLTGRRVPPRESVMLVGEALGPDLRLLIDALSRSIELVEDKDDPCETTQALAERLGVSTKTVGRWRDAGLRWRWGVHEPGGKPGVLIARSALAAFNDDAPGRVDAARGFARIDELERHRLIARARRLAEATGHPPQAVLNHLARRSGRSVEALRQLIRRHDEADPGNAVFADRTGPLTGRQKRVIDRAYRRGVTVSAMCRRFRKTRSTIYRAIHEARARRALALPIDVIDSPTFDREDADEVLMQPIKRAGPVRHLDRAVVQGLPAEVRPAYDHPIDADAVTRSLIVRCNFLKHRAKALQAELAQSPARAGELDRFDDLLRRANAVRGEVLAGTLPLALSVVLRQGSSGERSGDAALLSMLDRANAVLIQEVERFDAARSHTFESVLTNRLLRELATPGDAAEPIDASRLLDRLVQAGWVCSSE